MRIGQLADQLGLNPKTIRYYESIGLLADPGRTPAGYRIYGDDDLERLTFIKTAQRLSITLDEIREILALRDHSQRPCDYVRDLLHRQVDEIDERIAELRALRRQLVHLDEIADDLPDTGPSCCKLIDHARRQATSH